MAVLSETTSFKNFVTSTARNRRPGLIDNFFSSNPVFAMIRRNKAVELDGGEAIYENFVYAGMGGGSYGRNSSFDTSTREFSTAMKFDWKFNYTPVNLSTIDVELNDSPQRVFNLVDAAMQNAEMTLMDNLGTQLYADGTGNSSLDIDGLGNGVSQSGDYGGITRNTTANDPGKALRAGADDTTGGQLALASMNVQFGNCVVGKEKPNLIPTTQNLWNKIWSRSQPSERNASSVMREIGFESVRFNGADVTVDSHCPAGTIYLLNMNEHVLYVHRKWDMRFRGFMEQVHQQTQIGQVILWGNYLIRSPRTNGKMSSITET